MIIAGKHGYRLWTTDDDDRSQSSVPIHGRILLRYTYVTEKIMEVDFVRGARKLL